MLTTAGPDVDGFGNEDGALEGFAVSISAYLFVSSKDLVAEVEEICNAPRDRRGLGLVA